MPFTFKLGADPEFNIMIQQRKVHAQRIIKHLFPDAGQMGIRCGKSGELGWDGCSETAEIRPEPSNNPKELTKNIGTLIGALAKKGKLFDFSTLSFKGPVGGHIHLELTPTMKEEYTDGNRTKFQTQADSIMKRVTAFALPIQMGENKLNLKTRVGSGSYGQISDWRLSDKTIEMRSPSAEWLTTPKICESTLAFLGVIYHEVLNHPKNIMKYKSIIFKNREQMSVVSDITLSDYEAFLGYLLKEIKRAIRSFELYKEYKEECEYILNPLKVLRDKEKVGYNITAGWGFSPVTVPTKRQILSKKQVREATNTVDMESIANTIEFSFNDDMNVSTFVRELKNRMVAYGWKLKNSYFFFGLRSGVNDFLVADGSLKTVYHGNQIVSRMDNQAFISLFTRMLDRFKQRTHINEVTAKSCLMVGIPYNIRNKNNVNPFLEKILELEKGHLQPIELKELPNLPTSESKLATTILREDSTTNLMVDGVRPNPYSAETLRNPNLDQIRAIARDECAECGMVEGLCMCHDTIEESEDSDSEQRNEDNNN